MTEPVFDLNSGESSDFAQKNRVLRNFGPQGVVPTPYWEDEALYEVEAATPYVPVQPLPHDHGVTMFPLTPSDHHIIQVRRE